MRSAAIWTVLLVVLAGCGAGDNGGTLTGGSSRGAATSTPLGSLRARLPAAVAAAGRLRIGLGARTGFDADLAAALARVFGVTPELDVAPDGDQLAQVRAGRLDLAFTASGDTARVRAAAGVDEVDDRRGRLALLVVKGNPARLAGLDDLCGHRVAVPGPSAAADAVASHLARCGGRGATVVTGAEPATSLLVAGSVDGAVEDSVIAQQSADDSLPPHELVVLGAPGDPFLYGIAVSPDQPQLASAVGDALGALMRDGTYGALLSKWGQPQAALAAPALNGGA